MIKVVESKNYGVMKTLFKKETQQYEGHPIKNDTFFIV